MHSFPAEAEQGEALPSFSSHTVNSYPFHSLFSVTYFAFFCTFFFLVISLPKMAPKHDAEVLSSVPKGRKAVICLAEIYIF